MKFDWRVHRILVVQCREYAQLSLFSFFSFTIQSYLFFLE